jgi:hypothetical protein
VKDGVGGVGGCGLRKEFWCREEQVCAADLRASETGITATGPPMQRTRSGIITAVAYA